MDPKSFVDRIRLAVLARTVTECIETYSRGPSGRRTHQELLDLSRWFDALAEDDRHMVRRIARDVAHRATSAFLAVLDNTAPLEPTGTFELWYSRDGRRTRLNLPSGAALHELLDLDRW